MERKALKYIPYGKAYVETTQDESGERIRKLFSYTTLVLWEDEKYLMCYGLYSNTTRHHISAYMKEFHPELGYKTIKTMVEKNYCLYLPTGDFIDNVTLEVVGRV